MTESVTHINTSVGAGKPLYSASCVGDFALTARSLVMHAAPSFQRRRLAESAKRCRAGIPLQVQTSSPH